MAETLIINGQKCPVTELNQEVLSMEYHGYRVMIPSKAQLIGEESLEGWGGHDGVTLFIRQLPLDPGSGAPASDFLGVPAKIYPEEDPRRCYPPELPELVKHVKGWGWEVDPKITRRLGINTPQE